MFMNSEGQEFRQIPAGMTCVPDTSFSHNNWIISLILYALLQGDFATFSARYGG